MTIQQQTVSFIEYKLTCKLHPNQSMTIQHQTVSFIEYKLTPCCQGWQTLHRGCDQRGAAQCTGT